MAEVNDSENLDETMDEVISQAQSSLDDINVGMTDDSADPVAGPVTVADALDADTRPRSEQIELLSDVDLNVMIELGRTEMLVEDVLKLGEGSVVELDKLAGDPVDVYVNQRLIARGEVLVLNDNFCIRVSEIVDDLAEKAEAALQQRQAGAD